MVDTGLMTTDQLEELSHVICEAEMVGRPTRGPKSLAKAVEWYSNQCKHYCTYTLRTYDELAEDCRALSRDQYEQVMEEHERGDLNA